MSSIIEPIGPKAVSIDGIALVADISDQSATDGTCASVVSVFRRIVDRFAERIALTFANRSMTYRELDRRSSVVAERLQAQGVGRDVLVGICTERSLEMIVGILGILKAGGAYAPLDANYPPERLQFMIEDAACTVILTTRDLAASLPALSGHHLLMLDDAEQADATVGAALAAPGPRDLAYIMYTSGSTGRPKGVLIEHRSILRLVLNTNFCRLDENEVWLHYAPLPFDASTLEIWGALLNGGRLAIAPPKASLQDLGKLIQHEGVTSVWLTTGLFNAMVDERLSDLRGVRQLLAGGDVLSPAHVQRVLEAIPGCTLVNGYGPTENTTFTCCHVMPPGTQVLGPIPIGLPIAGTSVHILDAQLRPVAAGEIGEICTGGAGVARGYHNNAASTAEKFIPDPFAGGDARLYRTGDLGRQRTDGSIEFLGRMDNQVKILGHRIEPAEIEAVLGDLPGVKQACVAVHTDPSGGKRLIGYYLAGDEVLPPVAVRAYLTARLPRYMIPALLVPMCAMPLNPNGKIDRAALPRPDIPSDAGAEPEDAGENLEAMITATWRRILQVPRIGPDDNFFDAGGDSLRLVSVHADLERRLQREIAIVDLFEFTTPRSLARHLRGAGEGANEARERLAAERAKADRQRSSFARFQTARMALNKNVSRVK